MRCLERLGPGWGEGSCLLGLTCYGFSGTFLNYLRVVLGSLGAYPQFTPHENLGRQYPDIRQSIHMVGSLLGYWDRFT